MEELRQLAKYITPKDLNFPKIIKKSDASNQLERLYNHIREEKELSVEAFLPDNPNSYKYFNRLKNDLKTRLINSLLFIKPNKDESKLQAARNKCYKMLAVINQLRGSKFKQTAAKEAEKTIKIAIK
jgi:hypothetical protein